VPKVADFGISKAICGQREVLVLVLEKTANIGAPVLSFEL
jgi:hypothetical protein